MNVNPNIVIVDNEENELFDLTLAFSKAGIPCLPLFYDNSELEGPLPQIENTHCIRLICTDINLQDRPIASDDDKAARESLSGIASVLGGLNLEGPVFLVFWSKHDQLATKLVDLLEKRMPLLANKLIGYTSLNKNDYKVPGSDLKGDLLQAINCNPIFKALLSLEQDLGASIPRVFNSLFQSSSYNSDTFLKALASLANNAVGKDSAKESPLRALSTAIMPLINDKILTHSNSDTDNELKTALDNRVGSNVTLNDKIKLDLNTSISAEIFTTAPAIIERGSFYSLTQEQIYSLFDQEIKAEEIGANTGDCDLTTLLLPDFININSFNEKNTEHAQSLRDNIEFGVIEISAACDQSQNNRLIHPLALAVLIDQNFYSTIKNSKRSVTNSSTTYSECPGVNVNGKEKHIRVSGKYTFGLGPTNPILQTIPSLRYRDHIVEHIIEFCTKHAGRGGIFSIR